MQLSVIIVSYNVKYYLEQCLHSVLVACKNIQSEIIVIDNASSDNSIDYLKPKFSQVIFIQNEINTGFAKANNKALQQTKGKYILYLNPDTIVAENTIINCISFLDDHEVGAAGVKMIDGNGNFLAESKRAFPSITSSFFKLSGMSSLFPLSSILNKYAFGNLNENEVHEVDVLSGAFFVSRKEILLELNGYDEDFFMYGEDIDLSYRIKKIGFKNYYLGNNVIVHFKGESSKKNKAYLNNFYGAMKIFAVKHHRSFSWFLKPVITAALFLSSMNKKLSQLFSSVNNKIVNNKFILTGDESAILSAAEILSANNYTYQVLNLSDITALNNLYKKHLVFCVDESSASSHIQFMQINKNQFVCYWHYKDSKSIIAGGNSSAISQIYIPI